LDIKYYSAFRLITLS